MNNQSQEPGSDLERDKFILKVYEEVCTNIRTSDDISFKLLGLVPLISSSGAAILTLSKIWPDTSSIAILLISLVAMAVTFGLFKWEIRNVQKCDWLVARAAELERSFFQFQDSEAKKRTMSQFYGWDSQRRPPLFGRIPKFRTIEGEESDKERYPWYKKIGKTQAERIIYWSSIAAWLAPVVIALIRWRL